jgi:chromate reductase
MPQHKVGFIIGSIASGSINRQLSKALVKLAPPELQLHEIPIKDLPFYSYDHDSNFPAVATAFKQAISDADALLFITPEYNRSIPGVLKNAIDWASRPYGKNAFAHKPAGVVGASVGAIGTALSQAHLRGVLNYLDVPQLQQPEVYLHFKKDLVGADGSVSDSGTEAFLRKYMAAFAEFVAQHAARPQNTSEKR